MYDDLKEKFKEFHKKNPKVYTRLVELTKEAHDKGKTKIGMKMLFEVVRWNEFLETTDSDFKINNSYAPYYARLVMHQHPEFGEIFETRILNSSKVYKMFPGTEEVKSFKEGDLVSSDQLEGKKVIVQGSGRKATAILADNINRG